MTLQKLYEATLSQEGECSTGRHLVSVRGRATSPLPAALSGGSLLDLLRASLGASEDGAAGTADMQEAKHLQCPTPKVDACMTYCVRCAGLD